eukprot:1776801-Lingulodinium_polyedra.AAC.1
METLLGQIDMQPEKIIHSATLAEDFNAIDADVLRAQFFSHAIAPPEHTEILEKSEEEEQQIYKC